MKSNSRIGRVLAVLGSVCVGAAFAQGQGRPLIIPEADYIVDTNCDVLVATIRAVSEHAATRANSPVVDLKIDRVLRGKLPGTEKCKWAWPYDPSVTSPDGPGPTPEQQRSHEEYAKEPLEPPKIGSKWILLGEVVEHKSAAFFIPSYRYPLSKEKTAWALAEIERSKRLRAERQEYAGRWPESPGLPEAMLRRDARPVDADTPLQKGQPVLLNLGPGIGQLWRCRVVKTLKDGRVHVRPTGSDSRWDRVATRKRLLLYPEKWLSRPKEFRTRYSRGQMIQFAAMADLVVVGKVSSGPGIHGNTELDSYTFEIDKVLKGSERPKSVKAWVPLEVSILLAPRDKSYILFLQGLDPKTNPGPSPFYQWIPLGQGLVEVDDDTLRAVQSGLAR